MHNIVDILFPSLTGNVFLLFSCVVTEITTFKVQECYIKFPVTMPPSKGFLHTMCERVRGKGQSASIVPLFFSLDLANSNIQVPPENLRS